MKPITSYFAREDALGRLICNAFIDVYSWGLWVEFSPGRHSREDPLGQWTMLKVQVLCVTFVYRWPR